MKMRLRHCLLSLGATVFLAACTDSASPEGASERADERPDPPANVIAALEAAARGEAHPEDMHPETDRSGDALSRLQSAFDVRHYSLAIRVLPATRSIEGSVTVEFRARAPLAQLELDLSPKLNVRSATLLDEELAISREGGSLRINLPSVMAAGERSAVTVNYGGQPHIALAAPWYGGFVWSEVDGVPWFATAVQGDGCDLWWPCKDHFADKPDEGVNIAISAPRGVKIASVGVLGRVVEGEGEGDEAFDTWYWESQSPYTGYAIAINGGPYEVIRDSYTGINGTTYPIEFWALAANTEKARELIDSDVLPDLEFFERLLGPYPWGNEKVGFVETPHLGMEHQTINGYGEQYKRGRYGYDWLLHHELAHEWFGNLMTHTRAEDAWLHEGYGAYMQAVYAEETIGAIGYYDHLYSAYTDSEHCAPVANAAAADVGEIFDNRDIYTKATWMLHSLRRYIGEDAFWAGTRTLLYDTAEPWSLPYPINARYRSTEDFIRIMSEAAGEDIAWLVEAYLREKGMPELVTKRGTSELSLRWEVPGDRAFPMPVELSIDNELKVIAVSSSETRVELPAGARVLVDPQSKILRNLPIIGDCAEQTEEQIKHNIERYTRMAKEYGWQR